MSELSDVITASVVALGSIGTAAAFVWNKLEKRFRDIEAQLEECRKREGESQIRRGVMLAVIELLWSEIRRTEPTAEVLIRAKKLLDDLKDRTETERHSDG